MTILLSGTTGITAPSLVVDTPLSVASGGTGVTSSTGTGSNVLSASPTLTGAVTATNAINMGSSFMRNRFINGAMQVDQRNAGASGTASNVYTVDRWGYWTSQSTKGTWGQNLNSVTPPAGFPNYLGFQSSSAYSVLAADFFGFQQNIEGYNFADLGFGTASAQTVTLSFSVYSSLTGTFGGVLRNDANTRSYPFTYSINTANTWTSISVTIPGDTSGTWVGSTNGRAASVNFGLGAGSTYSGTAGAWASTNYVSATGAVSVVGTLNATFYVTGVQLEPGSVATPFERRPISEVLAQCQRYYFNSGGVGQGAFNVALYSAIALNLYHTYSLPVSMRTTPTITAAWSSLYNATNGAFRVPDTKSIETYIAISVAPGGFSGVVTYTAASAEL